MMVLVGFGGNIMCLFIRLEVELGKFVFILSDVCLWVFMDFDLARRMNDSGCCSLSKEFFMCSNPLFRNLGEQILRALGKKIDNATYSLVYHYILTNHNFDFQNSAIFAFIHDKSKRRIIEAYPITYHNSIPLQKVFFSKYHYL